MKPARSSLPKANLQTKRHTPPSAVALQCHGHGASRAIALAFGHLTRRVSRRTQQQSTPVGHVRLFGRSASVDSGVSVPVAAVFVDFSLSRVPPIVMVLQCRGHGASCAITRACANGRATSGTNSHTAAASGAGGRATSSANGRFLRRR